MMNRAGLSALIGGAPRRGGLAHLAQGETVLPSRAMAMDPSLRHHAMSSMARQGRDPMQYTMGARNMRNPDSGLSMFADLIYTDQGWVSADTGQAADFTSNQNSAANTGTFVPPPTGTPKQFGSVMENDTMFFGEPSPNDKLLTIGNVMDNLSTALEQADNGYVQPTGPKYMPPSGPKTPGTIYSTIETAAPPEAPTFVPLPSPEPPPPTLDEWQNPGTYDAWRANRNPQGKNVSNQFYGNAIGAGQNMGIDAQQQIAPNVIGAQMPVPMQGQWGAPGTALGFASDNNSDNPSILNSGYQQAVAMPYGAVQGAGWGGQGGGIGNGPGGAGGAGRQAKQPPNFQTMFNY